MKLNQIIEQARIVDNHIGYPMEMDFKNEIDRLTLLKGNIPPFDVKFYRGNDIFYLADKNDEYLGHIEYKPISSIKCESIQFTSTYTKVKGLYKIAFDLIFSYTNFKCIFGDKEQTKRAMKSWKRILQLYHPIVFDTLENKIINFKSYQDFEKQSSTFWSKNRESERYLIGVSRGGLTSNQLESLIFKSLEKIIENQNKHPRTTHLIENLTRRLDLTEYEANEMIEFFKEKK